MTPGFRKQCAARCAETGRQCGLLAPHPRQQHRSARGEFAVVAEPGQTRFLLDEKLTLAATSHPEASPTIPDDGTQEARSAALEQVFKRPCEGCGLSNWISGEEPEIPRFCTRSSCIKQRRKQLVLAGRRLAAEERAKTRAELIDAFKGGIHVGG